MIARVLIAALMLGTTSMCAGARGAAAREAVVRGVFAVIDPQPTGEDLVDVRRDGVNLVILQYTVGADEEFTSDRQAKLRQFIRNADSADLPYMIGLYWNDTWEEAWLDPRTLTSREWRAKTIDLFASKNVALTARLRPLLTKGFRGWYMPLEVGNAGSAAHYDYLASSFGAFKSLPEPVAMSVYFNPNTQEYLPHDAFAHEVAKFAACFNVLILQDSVGARRISDFAAELHPYYASISKVAEKGSTKFWADVEGFECPHVDADRQCDVTLVPADPGRVRRQVIAAREHTANVVGYDLVQFLAPRGGGPKALAYRAFVGETTRHR